MTFQNYLFDRKLTLKGIMQAKYIMIIHTLVLFLSTSLPAILTYSGEFYDPWYDLDLIERYLSGQSGILAVLVPAAAFISVYAQFSYLYRKNSAVFYGSVPKKRSCVFLSKYLSACVSVILPYVVITILNFALLRAFGADTGAIWGRTAFCLLQYIMAVSVFSAAAAISGNVFAQLISTGFAALIYPVTYFSVYAAVESCYNTYRCGYSPELKYAYPFISLFENDIPSGDVVFAALVTAVALAAGILLYIKRKNENTEQFFAYRFVNGFIKYYVTIIAAVVGGLAINEIAGGRLVGAYAGCALFGFIVFCIIQGIFEKSFKAMFSNIKGFVVVIVTALVLISIPVADPFKLDTRIPELKSIEIMPLGDESGWYYNIYDNNTILLKSPENLTAAKKLIKSSIENEQEFHKLADAGIDPYNNYNSRFNKTSSISIYINNAPFGIYRTFHYAPNKALSEFASVVYDSREYKNGLIEMIKEFSQDHIYVNKGYVSTVDFNDKYLYEEKNKLVSLLTDEIMQYDFDDMGNSSVFCTIGMSGNRGYISVPVYSCYEKTIEFLESYMVNDYSHEATERYDKLRLVYVDENGNEKENFEVADSEVIEKIVKALGYVNNFAVSENIIYSVYGIEYYDGEESLGYLGEVSSEIFSE